MRLARTLRILVLPLVAALLAVACGVDNDPVTPEAGSTTPPSGQSPTQTPSPSASPSPPTDSQDDVLAIGDQGRDVRKAQGLLKQLGHDVTVDGVFDDETENAVISFEMAEGLPGDGALDSEELQLLEEAAREQDQGPGDDQEGDEELTDNESENGVFLLQSGDRGRQVRRLQRNLEDAGYWVGPRDGVYGTLTEQAVLALQGVEGLSRDGVFGPNTRRALRDAAPPEPRRDRGDHVEIDEARGVILIVRNGETKWIFHTSTGTEESYQHPDGNTYLADTPNGRWTFSWEVDGWRDGRLGRMWRPKYFHEDGIAIHGYPTVPAHPASHGCARVTIEAMDYIWENDLAPQGSTVIVYGRG